jgi:peptide/nickel transport system substrate-binding protein
VVWSFDTLGTLGHPRYFAAAEKIAKTEITGPRSVRFTFDAPDRELALLMGLRPVLQKAQWQGRDFAASGLAVVPIGSGPYVIAEVDPGRTLRLVKNPDWWARDLPLMRGQMNLDEIRSDYFGDGDVVFEAFKAGLTSTFREGSAAKWASQYDFPRVLSGEVVKSLIPHQRPSGIAGFVMNTRQPQFADWRVRQAMIEAFNYEFISQTLNAAGDPRIASYFGNSILGMSPGPAEGDVLALLEPFRDQLPPGTLDGYSLPVGDGSERNRAGIRRAAGLLEEAGWAVRDGVLVDAAGQPFRLDILLLQGASETARMIDLYTPALNRLGITPRVSLVDSAQYIQRTEVYDFDMAYYTRALSLSPGNEQLLYWGHRGVTEPGTRNWMGMNVPAAEAMIQALLSATTREQSIAAAQALDRVLTAGRYVIPVWFSPEARIAHVRQLHYPPNLSIYGDYIGFQPDIWWWAE